MSVEQLIKRAFQLYKTNTEQRKLQTKPQYYFGYLKGGNELITKELLRTNPFGDNDELTVINHGNIACFKSQDKNLIASITAYLEEVIKGTNHFLLKEIKEANAPGWLSKYMTQKSLFDSYATSSGYCINSQQQMLTHFKQQQIKDKETNEWRHEQEQIKATVMQRSFHEEFKFIVDYVQCAFEGHTPEDIAAALNDVVNCLINDLEQHHYCLAERYAAQDERYAIADYLNTACQVKTGSDFKFFEPEKCENINTIDTHTHWQEMRKKVRQVIRNQLPNLFPKSLKQLLDDEEAQIPSPPPFNGLTLEATGSFGFSKRVHPKQLRYDQQEQGNQWLDVFCGALVAHYHQYIEVKQTEFIRQQMISLSDALITDSAIDCDAALLSAYKCAGEITH